MVTDAFSGRSARVMRSRYAEAMEASREALPAFLHMYALSDPLVAAAVGDEVSFHLYGQAAALNRDLAAADLMRRLIREVAAVFGKLSGANRSACAGAPCLILRGNWLCSPSPVTATAPAGPRPSPANATDAGRGCPPVPVRSRCSADIRPSCRHARLTRPEYRQARSGLARRNT